MARLASEAKMQYYPAPGEAIDGILRHLQVQEESPVNILDPCCGEGAAVNRLASGLPGSHRLHGIELHDGRADRARALIPTATVLGPCSFFGTRISLRSFGLVYLNPPFSDLLGGGGREEASFLTRATHLLQDDGILVFVAPATVPFHSDAYTTLVTWYTDLEAYTFPSSVRRFREVVIIGRKRPKAAANHAQEAWTDRGFHYMREDEIDRLPEIGTPVPTGYGRWGDPDPTKKADIERWVVPGAHGPPRTFLKAAYTEAELEAIADSTTVHDAWKSTDRPTMRRPGLAPSKGHASLFMVSGAPDSQACLTQGDGQRFLVRGQAKKSQYRSRVETTTSDTTVTTKVVMSEHAPPQVTCLREDGEIFRFAAQVAAPSESDSSDAEPESED